MPNALLQGFSRTGHDATTRATPSHRHRFCDSLPESIDVNQVGIEAQLCAVGDECVWRSDTRLAPTRANRVSLDAPPLESDLLANNTSRAAPPTGAPSLEPDPSNPTIQQDRLWSDGHWTAKVIKNEDDDGWAVAMTPIGQSEPALVGPWTMGRDKKNPKPLDTAAFATLVKTASEVIRRHQQQAHDALHKSTKVATASGRVRVQFDIVPDEDSPHAHLSAFDDSGTELARVRVPVTHRFSHDSASAWVASGYASLDSPESN